MECDGIKGVLITVQNAIIGATFTKNAICRIFLERIVKRRGRHGGGRKFHFIHFDFILFYFYTQHNTKHMTPQNI